MNPIKFFGADKSKKWWRFSNFAELPIIIDGIKYPTSEHYFQAAKFASTDPEYAEKIRLTKTAKGTKTLGKSRDHPIDPKWDSPVEGELLFKDLVMKKAIRAKAEQHPEFLQDLLSTGTDSIVEASPWDNYWGSGRSGNGKNMLGKLLVELRDLFSPTIKTKSPNLKTNEVLENRKCNATTKKGEQCKKAATVEGFCYIHCK